MSGTVVLASLLFLLIGICGIFLSRWIYSKLEQENANAIAADEFIRKKLGPKDYLYWLDLSTGREKINDKEVKK